MFQIWKHSRTKKVQVFLTDDLGLLLFFQNISSFMEVFWINNLAIGTKLNQKVMKFLRFKNSHQEREDKKELGAKCWELQVTIKGADNFASQMEYKTVSKLVGYILWDLSECTGYSLIQHCRVFKNS